MKLTFPIDALLQKILVEEKVKHKPHEESQKLIEFLLAHDFDYFDIVRVVAMIAPSDYTENEVRGIISMIPKKISCEPISILKLSALRSMIPRWTGTQYHSGNIKDVILDIQHKCERKEIGIYVYNSNMNVKNRRSANDPYILLVTSKQWYFLDINRRRVYRSADLE